jgi:phosphonate transport system permease protein
VSDTERKPPAPAEASGDACTNGKRDPASLALEDVTPRWTAKKKVLTGVLWGVVVATLVWSYVTTRIDPLGLWSHRQNGIEYLFGRTLSQKEKDYIRQQAARAPEYTAKGEAHGLIADKYDHVPNDQKPSVNAREKEQLKLRDQILANMSEERKTRLIEEEYERLVDSKKGGYFPPETAPPQLASYFDALLETIAIAIWGSILAAISAIPLSVLAASNTLAIIAPGDRAYHRYLRWIGVVFVRRFLDFCRAFNEFVMAMIFVAVIGLGPFAGVLALWIHTTGILGKVFSEAIEAIEPGQVEALSSTGAGPIQTIGFSVIPQIMPNVVSYSLLRFESNVRSATILGFVGAGGIGFLMHDKMLGYLYPEVCTMMIMVIVTVSIIDYLCSKLRKRFI